MKTALLWKQDYRDEESAIMIDSSDVTPKISLHNDTVYLFSGLEVTAENEAKLTALIAEFKADQDGENEYSDLQDFFTRQGIDYDFAGETESLRSILCYSTEDNSVGNLEDYETQKAHEYYDGSNFKLIWLDESITETVVEYDDEHSEDLDDLDENSNFYYIHKFEHGRKYPIISIDGEKVEGKYLVESWSQYQGSLLTGKIVDADWTVEEEKEERKLRY